MKSKRPVGVDCAQKVSSEKSPKVQSAKRYEILEVERLGCLIIF